MSLNLGIATSVSGGYGKYLAEWARSLLALTVRPQLVGIFTHGSPADFAAGLEAAKLLGAGGIEAVLENSPERLDFGAARNRAIALLPTEWVQHFDCDDLAMPHMLEDVAELAPRADVVGLGYERCGDLRAGPPQRTKLYQSHQGEATLANPTPCSGVSPFRRSLWERSPYRTDLIGGWDTALWIGFGHLNARFVPTRRPCFFYRQHADSTFNRRRKDPWLSRAAGLKFNSLRRRDAGVSIVVPRSRTDSPERLAAWRWLRRWYERHFPDWQLVEGVAGPGSWIKGAAVAEGLSHARGAILIIADSDCVVPAPTLRAAVLRVELGAPWVVPHDFVHRLSRPATEAVLAADLPPALPTPARTDLVRQPYHGFAGGGIVVVPRLSYELAGGLPSTFAGWGGEDEALAYALDCIVGKHERLGADLVHLWHPPAARGFRGNRSLVSQYQDAARQVERMRHLILSGSVPNRIVALDPIARAADIRARQHATRVAVLGAIEQSRQPRAPLMQPTTREDLMAGARDVKRAYQQRLAAQRERNAEATADLERRREAAFGPRSTAHSAKARFGEAEENKMLPANGGENKGSGVTITIPARRPAATMDDTPQGIPFSSKQARDLARKEGLTLMDFTGREPGPNGFTLDYVKKAIAKRKAAPK